MKLTHQAVTRLSPPLKGSRDVKDDLATGLYLRINATGSRVWRYRYKAAGKVRILTLGQVGIVSLKEARGLAAEAATKLRAGGDPGAEAQYQSAERRRMPTVEEFAAEYIERHAKPYKKSWKADQSMLAKWVIPRIGRMKLDDVHRRDVVMVLDDIRDAGYTRAPGHVLAVVRRMFRLAVERGVLDTSPVIYVTERQPPPARKAMSTAEIIQWWEGTTAPNIMRPMGLALRLLLLTGQRPGEVVGLRVADLDLQNEEGPIWKIPPELRKHGKAQTIALTPWAVEVIREALELSDGVHLFLNARGGPGRVDSGLGAAVKRIFADAPGRPTPHAARHTVATELEALDYEEQDIARVLGHQSVSVTGRVYINRRSVTAQRRTLEAWERRLREIVTDEPLDNVVKLNAWNSV